MGIHNLNISDNNTRKKKGKIFLVEPCLSSTLRLESECYARGRILGFESEKSESFGCGGAAEPMVSVSSWKQSAPSVPTTRTHIKTTIILSSTFVNPQGKKDEREKYTKKKKKKTKEKKNGKWKTPPRKTGQEACCG